ncbi:hypothetical protein ABMA27_006539 [Loxostege sticticalis]|uniref:RNA-directed DNA polymerase n=1 Tax=Loxostege sticticalis TaxID=481309 RepID=A0ABR3IJI1_LOXSC
MSNRGFTPSTTPPVSKKRQYNLVSREYSMDRTSRSRTRTRRRRRYRFSSSDSSRVSDDRRRSSSHSRDKKARRVREQSHSAVRTRMKRSRSHRRRRCHHRHRSSSCSSSDLQSVRSRKRRHDRHRSRSKSYRSRSPPSKRVNMSDSKSNETLIESLVSALKGSNNNKGNPITHMQGAQNIITEFDPNSRSQTMKDWIRKINESAEIYGWSEQQTIFYALPKLSGLAKKWYDGLTSVKYSWVEWQEKLLKTFPCDQNYGDQLTEMLNRKSRRNETLIEYYYDKIMLVNRCQLKGRQAVDCITHGIYDNNIRMNIQGANYDDPEQVLNYFRNVSNKPFDSFSQRRVQTNDNRDRLYSDTQNKKPQDPSQDIKTRYSNDTTGSKRSLVNVTCYNCGEPGHTVVRCTKEIIKCTKCKRHGHKEVNCTFNSGKLTGINNADAKTKNVLNIEGNPDNNKKYFKKVKVNEVEMNGYIDFGSECTLISDKQCQNLKLNVDSKNLPTLRGFGNSYIVPSGRTNIRLSVDLVQVQLTAFTVPAELLPADVLIGQSLTEHFSVRVFKTDKELVLYQITANKSNSLVLKVVDDGKIDIDTLVPVTCSSDYTGFVSVTSDIRREGECEYFILPGIYSISNGNGCIIAVSLNKKTVIIKKGKVIARGISVPKSVLDSEESSSYIVNVRRLSSDTSPIIEENLNIGEQFEMDNKTKLLGLLNSYRDCFAFTTGELGQTSVAEMHIKLNDSTPVTYRPYRLSLSEREKVQQIVNELMSNKIIRESNSEYASPIILVAKKNGESRLCVDYRALNRKTVKDKYPMPLIEDQIDKLQGHTVFTTLDLSQGYHQIPVSEESKHLTAFVTPDGHFEYNRMPFGLTNAPAVFQRMVHSLLNKHKVPGVLAYMDDIVIGSKSIDEGMEKLQRVLDMLREANLTLNIKKCHFFKTTIEYLGFEISADGVRPGLRKVEAVAAFPTPRNPHEIRQFIGLASFFRRFVRNFATLAKPLTSLTKADAKWSWGQDQLDAFVKIKEILTTRPVLAIYNPNHSTELHTDASQLGIGGVLLQREHEKSPLTAVAYFSRQTTPEEQHLHSFELETLAVVMSLERFRVYLLGIQFKVVTDCNALRTALTKRDLVPRIARWWLLVQDYDFTVEYRPGTQMQHADSLSRNPLPCDDNHVELDVLKVTQNEHSLLAAQISDPKLKLIKCILDKNCTEAKEVNNNYVLKDGRIFRKVGDAIKWAVPRDARWKVCLICHDESGHFSFEKTLEKMRRDYWFPGMARFVRKYVRACIPCAYAKEPAGKKQGLLHPIPKPNVPFECVHIDHVGPFTRSKTGNTYILGIVDAFTKFIVLRAVRNTKSRTSIQVLRDFIGLFGSPKVIVSDRGTSFTSDEFKRFVDSHQIKHVKNAVATPRANGQIERYNRSILSSLTALNINEDDRNWDSDLSKVQWSLNNTLNKGIGKTPAQVVFGKETVSLSESHLHDISENLTVNENVNATREEVSTHISKEQEKMKTRFDGKRCAALKYKVGDLVMVLKNVHNVGNSNKLVPPYSGPYKVSAVLGNDRYEVCSVDGFSNRKYKNVYSADKMKPWIRFDPQNSSESDNDCSETE